ncbi:hypothetical protein [Streptomyces sp. NPDC047000]|uniref:hypothetical protein n=1 Tax=Streptomyces sp. NPDC047000 TaxID=3155474 RepID=UPI00340DDAD1
MTPTESLAHGLVDEFFAEFRPRHDKAEARWRDKGELDRVTVSQLRLWAANRALAALTPGSPSEARARTRNERQLLGRWLTENNHRGLDRAGLGGPEQ